MSAPAARYGEGVSWQPERPRFKPLRVLLSWALTAASLAVAAMILPGVDIAGYGGALAVAAVVAVLNALLPPLLAALRLPFMLALGFVLVLILNALVLQLASDLLDNTFTVDNFGWALLAALLVAAVSVFLEVIFGTNDDDTYTVRVVQRIARRQGGGDRNRRSRDHLPGDRRARAAGAPEGDAGRERLQHGPLGRRRHARADRVGDRPLLADGGEPGGDPARLQRGHPRVPLGGQGERHADGVLRSRRLCAHRGRARHGHRPARQRRLEPRQPALGRGRGGHPHRQPHGGREESEPRLSRVLRQRVQRHASARAVLLGGDPRVDCVAPGDPSRRAGREVTAAASIRSCAARCA